MKKILLLCTLYMLPFCLSAVNYCAESSWGYAGTTVTGGGKASPTLVKSESELKNALKSGNKVIVITQSITLSEQISTDKSNITLIALSGAKLINNTQTQSGSGILYLKGSNIILRNLTFEGPGAYDCDGKDNLTLDGAKKIWVDHCDFQDGCDGNFDIKGLSDNITVSWCRFRYLKAPKSGGSGGADDHRFTNLIGSSSSDKPADGTYNITYGFCWWDEGCKQRMTRCRNCELHFLNCYWNSSVADYYVGPENARCYFEGCTFAGKANSAKNIYKGFNSSTNYCKFVNCTGNLPADKGSVAAPAYTYDQLSAATAKNHVTDASCGAGATLSVTQKAEITSSCDSKGNNDDDDDNNGNNNGGDTGKTPVSSGNCCINLGLGEEPSSANGGIPAEYNRLAVTATFAKSTWDQGYLNLGGNADYITFDFSAYDATLASVEFDVTIPNWAEGKNTVSYHWNNEANTKYTVSGNATETIRLTAPEKATSFTIQRSASTGTRIAQICFAVTANTTSLDNRPASVPARKILRNGRLLILRGNTLYTPSGNILNTFSDDIL